MAQYVVTDTELESVADAIRSKLGSSDSLEWPSAFVSAIGDIAGDGNTGNEPVIISRYLLDFTPTQDAYSAVSAGWKFKTLNGGLMVRGIRFYARASVCNVYISDNNGIVVASKQNVSVISGQWNDIDLDSPIKLTENTEYVVWGSNQNVPMKYINYGVSTAAVTLMGTYYSRSYNTFPTTYESSTTYGIDLIVEILGAYGVPVLTRSEWNALTTDQKKAYGLIAIQDTSSGFDRGELINGSDYSAELNN